MFVQSSRPPSPTSITAMSTFCSSKYLKAMAVVSSKKEGWSDSKKFRSFSTKSTTNSLLIICPFTRMRSLKSTRCGDVKRPTLSPLAWSIDANV